MRLNEKLLRLLAERGWTQTEFAHRLGAPKTTVSHWFNRGRPNPDHLKMVADLFKVPVDYLLDDSIDEPTVEFNDKDRQLKKMMSIFEMDHDEVIKLMAEAYKKPQPFYEIPRQEKKKGS